MQQKRAKVTATDGVTSSLQQQRPTTNQTNNLANPFNPAGSDASLLALRWLAPVPSSCASWPSPTRRTLALLKAWSHCASAWSSWPSLCPWVWTAATPSTRPGTSDLASSPLWPAGAWRCSGSRARLMLRHNWGFFLRRERPSVYYSGADSHSHH